MKTLTVAQRLALGFAAVVAITATLGLMAFARLQSVSGAATYLATDPVPGTVTVLQIEARLMENASFAQMHINAADHGKYDALIAHNIEYIGQQIAAYEATIVEDADRQLFAQFKSAREEFVTAFKQVLVLSRAGKARERSHSREPRLPLAHGAAQATKSPGPLRRRPPAGTGGPVPALPRGATPSRANKTAARERWSLMGPAVSREIALPEPGQSCRITPMIQTLSEVNGMERA